MQRVYLEPKNHYWKKYHDNFIRGLIELGEINNYDTLVHYCRGRVDIKYTAKQPNIKIHTYR